MNLMFLPPTKVTRATRQVMTDLQNMVAHNPDAFVDNADRLLTYAYITSSLPAVYDVLPLFVLRELARLAQVYYLLDEDLKA